MFTTFCLVFCTWMLSLSTGVRILPYKFESPECSIPDDRETCSLQGLHDVYKGRKYWKSPNKFVLLWPMPHGDYEKVRRLCHACDMEVAEVWDEDDANQIVDLLKSKNELDVKNAFNNASFWLGETQERDGSSLEVPSVEAIQQLKFLHQDGFTQVQFHFLRGQKSFTQGYSTASGLSDANKDCIVIGPDPKQNDKISWFVQSCRARSNFGLCQFKRKHHCYDEAPLPSTRQLQVTSAASEKPAHKPQPYYLSNYPLSWTLAKAACEKTNKSLLFFDSRDEEQYFTKAFGKLLSEKEHLEPGFWSAGQFEEDKLTWQVGTQKLTIPKYRSKEMQWNFALTNKKGRTASRNKTGAEYSKGEGCVYFEGGGTASSPNKWGIAECERSMRFFVCKDPQVEFEKKSSVEYCEGNKYVNKERYECKWNLVLKKQKPKCVCVEGVHGLTDHASCNSRLVIGPKCIKLSQKGVVHWKILSRSLVENEEWMIVQLRSQESGRFIEWFALQRNATRQMFGNANIYYSGLKAVQLENSRICFQRAASTTKGVFYELKIRNSSSILEFPFEKCPSGTQVSFRVHKTQKAQNECSLEPCKKPLESYEGHLMNQPESDVHTDIPVETKSANAELNEKMLAFKIDKAFGKAKPLENTGPIWKVLRTLMGIVKRLCSCLVSSPVLDDALELFQVAHAGQEYSYVPRFTVSETAEIISMLNNCDSAVQPVLCETSECSGRAVKVSDKQITVGDSGLQGTRHHHVFEIVWLAISSVNAACLKHFKPSYLQFHHLEQSMESLFTEEIRKLWHYPSVDPNYFQMLLGPFEATDLGNLKSCAGAIHGVNPEVMELMRPKQAKGKNLGERIRARKFKDKDEARGYDALAEVEVDNDVSLKDSFSSSVFCSRDEFCLK